jgi:hypothetical protein
MAILVSPPRLPSAPPEPCSWPVGGAPESISSRSAADGLPPRSCDEPELWTGIVSDSLDDSASRGISSTTACGAGLCVCGAGPAGVGGGGVGGA